MQRLFKFSSRLEHRVEQQNTQAELDNRLVHLSCSETVSQLLLHERKINREQTLLWSKTPLWDIPRLLDLLDQQLDQVDQHQNQLRTVLDGPKPCNSLTEFLQRVNNVRQDHQDPS